MTYFTDLSIFPGDLSAVVRHHWSTMLQENQQGFSIGSFLPARRQTLEEMLSAHILGIVQPPCQEGKISAAHAIPAISGRLIFVGVVIQAFVLLELEGDI